jgi:hypothetical protein
MYVSRASWVSFFDEELGMRTQPEHCVLRLGGTSWTSRERYRCIQMVIDNVVYDGLKG